MEQNNTYKYLSIALAVIAIIFAILYFTKTTQPATDSIGDASTNIETCRNSIATWRQANSNQATTTEQGRADLMAILEDCEDVLTGNNTI